MSRQKVVLLGATGSIGDNTLKVIRGNRERLQLVGIAGNSNCAKLADIANEFDVPNIAVCCPDANDEARTKGLFGNRNLLRGQEGLEEIACLPKADVVVVATVGTVALHAVLKAIEAGKEIALASKEVLVVAGQFVMEAARRHNTRIIPVDSEHNAIFQCLQGSRECDIRKLLLTASGGPFREMPEKDFATITPEQALKHPNWSMGPKITVDSSTMANKGLEVIEAKWLFGVTPDQIQVVVHPESIVHSMVEFVDGAILAQLSPPSMTFAIQYALLYPERYQGVTETIDFARAVQLNFTPPDLAKFPCLGFAFDCLKAGGAAPAIYNTANDVAVEAFLNHKLPYLGIAWLIEQTLSRLNVREPRTLDDVLHIEKEAREYARNLVSQHSLKHG